MSLVKIYYSQGIKDNFNTPFSLDGVGFEPESLFESSLKSSIYYECPAWRHKTTRTFLIKSPVDIKFTVDVNRNKLICDNLTKFQFDEFFGDSFIGNWCTEDKTTIQLAAPRFLFWTKSNNVWIESRPHPETAVKNNLIAIPGWFNLSNWGRPLNAAFDVVDLTKPVIINRGDPLFQVCFYPKDLNSGIKLIKKNPTQDVIDTMFKVLDLKQYISKISHRFLFKNKESKCPFHFMWK